MVQAVDGGGGGGSRPEPNSGDGGFGKSVDKAKGGQDPARNEPPPNSTPPNTQQAQQPQTQSKSGSASKSGKGSGTNGSSGSGSGSGTSGTSGSSNDTNLSAVQQVAVNGSQEGDDDGDDGRGSGDGGGAFVPPPPDDFTTNEPVFRSRTNAKLAQLEEDIEGYRSVVQGGGTGTEQEAAANETLTELYTDTADELRQHASQSANSDAVIQQQSAVIRDRIDPESRVAELAGTVVDQAAQDVLAETPEQRALEIKRTRVLQAQETLEALEAMNGPRGALRLEMDDARAEYQTASSDFQEAVLTEVSAEVAAEHLDTAQGNMYEAMSQGRVSEGIAAVNDAQAQADAVEQGQVPLEFIDAEMQAALTDVKERYAGMGLDGYVDALGGAITSSRDRVEAAQRAPQDLGVEVAQVHYDNAQAAMSSGGNPAQAYQEMTAAADQLGAAQDGEVPTDFTDSEMAQAVTNLKARNAAFALDEQYDVYAAQLIDNRNSAQILAQYEAALAEARENIAANIPQLASNTLCVAGVSQELATSDPVTAAFIAELGVSVDPNDPTLSIQEQTIARADPVAFALMQRAGIRIETTDVNTTVVTIDGAEQQLTPEQQQLIQNNDVFGLAGSLLSNRQFDIETYAIMDATREARQTYTATQVSSLMDAGQDGEALRVLDVNMSAAFSAEEADTLWAQNGETRFTQDYFNGRVDTFVAQHGQEFERAAYAGDWLQTNFSQMPAQAADRLLGAFTSKIDSGIINTHGSGVLFNALSSTVEQASPATAADVATWMLTPPAGGYGGTNVPMGGYGSLFQTAITEGHGTRLSGAITDLVEGQAPGNELATSLRYEFDTALQTAVTDQYTQVNREVFANFERNRDIVLNNFFDSFATGPDVTQWVGAEDTPALHNMVGRALGLTPTNAEAANALDDSQNWYDSGEQRNVVDLTVRVLLQEAGADGQIRAIPAYLAGDIVGAQSYTLFEVTRADLAAPLVIDGTALSNMIYLNPALVKPEGGIVDTIDGMLFDNYRYQNFQNFIETNNLPDTAHLYLPTNYATQGCLAPGVSLLSDADGNGNIDWQQNVAAITTTGEQIEMAADIVITVGSIGAGVVLAIPTGGTSLAVAAGIAATGMMGVGIGWGTYRGVQQVVQMNEHGQSLSLANPNARAAYINLGANGLGILALGSGLAASRLATTGSRYASAAATASRATGWSAQMIGVVQTGQQGHILLTSSDQMTDGQRAYEWLNFGLGIADMGVGRWADGQGRILGQTQSQALAAVNMVNEGRVVPRDFGALSLDSQGAIAFTSAETGRTITIRDTNGNVRLDTLDPATRNWLSQLDPKSEIDIQGLIDQGLLSVDTNSSTAQQLFAAGAALNAPAVEEWAAQFGITGPIQTSQWTQSAVQSLRLVGQLAQILTDIHSHPRDYGRRSDIPPGSRLHDLALKLGPLARILMGDIPQCCGLPHYSNVNSHPLFIDGGPLEASAAALDTADVAAVNSMIDTYRSWSGMIETIRALGVADENGTNLADRLDTTVLTAARNTDTGAIIGADRDAVKTLIEDVAQANPALARQLTLAADQSPHMALRVDLSMTGFNPGGPDAADYIRSRLLAEPGRFSSIGEATLQKEYVAVMLGGEATLLKPAGYDGFMAALNAYIDPATRNTGDLMRAIGDLRANEAQSENLKTHLRALNDAIATGDSGRIKTAAESVHSALAQWETDRAQNIENFKNALAFCQESGLNVLIHCDWGEALTGLDGRLGPTVSDYRYFKELSELVSRYGADGDRPAANIVLAHTGFGRFVRPDETLISHKLPDGAVLQVPRHIAHLYQAKAVAPDIKFDISWNDVGEAFVMNPNMLDGLMDFMARHPDSVFFGSDTVKPGSQPLYRQASTTLMPLFLNMALNADPAYRGALKGLVLDNYFNHMRDVDRRVAAWTEQALRAEHGAATEQMIASMNADRTLLNDGRENMYKVASRLFDDILAGIENLQQQPFDLPALATWQPDPGMTARDDIFNTRMFGEAPELDPVGFHVAEQGMFTSHGLPATQGTINAATARAALDVLGTVAFGLGGGVLSMTPLAPLTNLASFGRQLLFAARIQYGEFVRTSWEAIFEKGQATDGHVRVFLDRVLQTGKALGIEEQDLKRVVELTIQFQTDYAWLSRVAVQEAAGFDQARKQEATIGLTGLYQINVDRTIGVQSSALNPFDHRSALGRSINNGIMRTAGMSAGSSIGNLVNTAANGNPLQTLLAGAGTVFDSTALGTMIVKAVYENFGGRTNIARMESHPVLRYVQTASLASLAGGGAVRFIGDVAALATGNIIATPLLIGLDAGIAWLGGASALHEFRRASGRGTWNPGKIADLNTRLVATIAMSSIARLIAQSYAQAEREQGNEERESGSPAAANIMRPFATTPTLPLATPASAATTPTPTPALPPPLVPTPLADLTPVTVTASDGLNVRSGPSIQDTKLGAFSEDTVLQPTGRQAFDGDGNRWIQIAGRTPGEEVIIGWVAAEYVEKQDGADAAPTHNNTVAPTSFMLGRPLAAAEFLRYADHPIPV